MEAKAKARFVRVTPQKARRVVDLIRGKQAGEAVAVLKFAPQAAGETVLKVVESAIANAREAAKRSNDSDTLPAGDHHVLPTPDVDCSLVGPTAGLERHLLRALPDNARREITSRTTLRGRLRASVRAPAPGDPRVDGRAEAVPRVKARQSEGTSSSVTRPIWR